MSKKNTSSKNPVTHPLRPPETSTQPKLPPYMSFPHTILDLRIFKNSNMLRLFLELRRAAPDYGRFDTIDNEEIWMPPRQGIFAGRKFSPLMKLGRITLWRYMKILEKEKFLKRRLQQSYSIYTLTGKGLVDFELYKRNIGCNAPVESSATVQETHSLESRIKSSVRENKKVDRKHYRILLNTKNKLAAQAKILKNSSCSRLDDGLNEEMKTWIIAGSCIANQEKCRECVPHLKILFSKMNGRAPRSKRAYVETAINQYYYPHIFQTTIPE